MHFLKDTICVKNDDSEDGTMIINACDFDPKVHEEVAAPEPKSEDKNPVDDMGKEDLIQALSDAEIDFNKNLGEKKLRKLLNEAIAAQIEESGESAILGVIAPKDE